MWLSQKGTTKRGKCRKLYYSDQIRESPGERNPQDKIVVLLNIKVETHNEVRCLEDNRSEQIWGSSDRNNHLN